MRDEPPDPDRKMSACCSTSLVGSNEQFGHDPNLDNIPIVV
jgi:hypothetical protein